MIDAANYTCTDCPADVDEFQLSGLTPVASSWADGQGPPRVGEAQYAMECELHSSVPFHSDQDPSKTTANLVLGRIVRFVIKKGAYCLSIGSAWIGDMSELSASGDRWLLAMVTRPRRPCTDDRMTDLQHAAAVSMLHDVPSVSRGRRTGGLSFADTLAGRRAE